MAANLNLDTKSLPVAGIVDALLARGALNDQTARAIRGLVVMRGLAVHAPDTELGTKRALEFITLANAVLYTLGG